MSAKKGGLSAELAILGVPIDTASSYRVGTRFGPRSIREVSMFHGFGPEGVFDFEDEVTYLTAEEVKIVDAGDSDVIYADTKRSLANAELAVRALLDAKTMPYILGGDHALRTVHFDALVIAIAGAAGIGDQAVAASRRRERDRDAVVIAGLCNGRIGEYGSARRDR